MGEEGSMKHGIMTKVISKEGMELPFAITWFKAKSIVLQLPLKAFDKALGRNS